MEGRRRQLETVRRVVAADVRRRTRRSISTKTLQQFPVRGRRRQRVLGRLPVDAADERRVGNPARGEALRAVGRRLVLANEGRPLAVVRLAVERHVGGSRREEVPETPAGNDEDRAEEVNTALT